jgi:hypothetical protein
MKTEYYPTHKTANDIRREIEMIRRLSPTRNLNRRVSRPNHRLRMAVAVSSVAATIAGIAYFWKP